MSLYPHIKCLVYTYQTNLTKYLVQPSKCTNKNDVSSSFLTINQLINGYKIVRDINTTLYIYQHGKIIAQYTFHNKDWRYLPKIVNVSFFIHNQVKSFDFKYLKPERIDDDFYLTPLETSLNIIHKIDDQTYLTSYNNSKSIDIQQYKGKFKHGANIRFKIVANPNYKAPKNIQEENAELRRRKRDLKEELRLITWQLEFPNLQLQPIPQNAIIEKQNRIIAIEAELKMKTYFYYDITDLYPITKKKLDSYIPEFIYRPVWQRKYIKNKLNGPWINFYEGLPHGMIQQGRHKDDKLHGIIFTFNKYRTKNRYIYYYYDLQIYINGKAYGSVRTVVYKKKDNRIEANIYTYNYEPFLMVKNIPHWTYYKPDYISI